MEDHRYITHRITHRYESFYNYDSLKDSRKLVEFLQHISPVKYKTAQKLIGHDVNNATYNYKQESLLIL